MFQEDTHAWPWGPVIADLYPHFKSAGRSAIQGQRATVVTKAGGRLFDYTFEEPPAPEERIMEFLHNVWETHKGYTGVALSNATHAAGEPWTIIHDLHSGDLASKPLIPLEVIKDVFAKKAEIASRVHRAE